MKYCSYYKYGKNEELACKGYLVVKRLLSEGKDLDFENDSVRPGPATADKLIKTLCMGCDFHENDCDFMQDRAARPCGGFVVLERYLRARLITLDDIR